MRDLSEMTLAELWELFPIVLTAPNPHWHIWYEEQRKQLEQLLPMDDISRISHIGSTAINGIWAKPTIDILVERKLGGDLNLITHRIQEAGFNLMCTENDRISFNKGYTPSGFAEKVFHLHLRPDQDNDELYFRDYLNEHLSAAKEYEKLKFTLWPQFEHDRDGYTKSKTDFVQYYTKKAKAAYGERYHT